MMLTNRRKFLKSSAISTAALSLLSPAHFLGANDTINLGFIGLGRRGLTLLKAFHSLQGVRVLAGSDVYGRKNDRFQAQVKQLDEEAGYTSNIRMYKDYRDLLGRSDIDAVVIVTPDHWHALQAIDACRAGKDVYLEKPLTFTITEGRELCKAVDRYNRVLAVGSQQRSMNGFKHAIRMVHEGRIGTIGEVTAYVGGRPPVPYDLPKEEVPVDLDWDKWLGPNQYVHYNKVLNPPISLNPEKNEEFWGGWRWFRETGGGLTTDWGAHMFDIAQWGLKMDNSGPVRIVPPGSDGADHLEIIYSNGVKVIEKPFDENKTRGVKFHGSDGWIEVSRQHYKASDPALAWQEEEEQETNLEHAEDFILSIRERKQPIVPVETGHRSCTVCNISNVAYELNRPVDWNPGLEEFVNDPQASLYLHRHYRDGYILPRV